MKPNKCNIFWFRRDLRLEDNRGLWEALNCPEPVLPIFIFDTDILKTLPRTDARVQFIHHTIEKLNAQLNLQGKGIRVETGTPSKIFRNLTHEYRISKVFANEDYEPYGIKRDEQIKQLLDSQGIAFHTFPDHILFPKNDILKADNTPYLVYTPYKNAWLKHFNQKKLTAFPSETLLDHIYPEVFPMPALKKIGFHKSPLGVPEANFSSRLLNAYELRRDYPSEKGTSRLGPHLRFGTCSIRQVFRQAFAHSECFRNQLIWREFYSMILYHFPHVSERAFKKPYDRIPWLNHQEIFERWCKGETGYPMVDAGMRQLNRTGYMHNRLRMLTASFLSKFLLVDWRWGEAYFAEKLLDFELANNNGGWQWAAGTGTDAQPYFRIFNPETQIKKWDKEGQFLDEWVPERHEANYPDPIVEYK
ncbi:MAG: DNA photolyase family protein, partial [Cytophagales bacterium]|nr:DNA photolyase family protein [Cytophagales bacterium]